MGEDGKRSIVTGGYYKQQKRKGEYRFEGLPEKGKRNEIL